jgi:hypothetical protein
MQREDKLTAILQEWPLRFGFVDLVSERTR